MATKLQYRETRHRERELMDYWKALLPPLPPISTPSPVPGLPTLCLPYLVTIPELGCLAYLKSDLDTLQMLSPNHLVDN